MNVNGINGNGITLAKDGSVYLKKKQVAPRVDDPEFQAEVRYAKENGLDMPRAPEPAKVVEHPRALSTRNRSKSTSDVKATSPKPAKSSKAERKARNRAVSGCWNKKDGNRFEYGLDDWNDEQEEDYAIEEYDDTIVDDGDEYVDYVFKYDAEKVRGALAEYFNNGNCSEVINELAEHLYNNDSVSRVTKEIVNQSLEIDNCHVALGYRLLKELLKNKSISEKAIFAAFEETLADLDNLIKDMPRARENLTLLIAKAVDDKVLPRLVFDDISNKLDDNRLAVSCALEVYFYLTNRSLLTGKFDSIGSFEPLDVLDDQMERILQEFIVSGDSGEVARRLNALRAQHYNHEFVYLVGYHAVNRMNQTLMQRLADLLKYLLDAGCLLRSSLKPGFDRLFKSLNDLYIDLPAAYSLNELFVKMCQTHGFLDDSIVTECPKPSGKRARTLSESDENGKIFVLDTPIKNGF